MSATVTTELLVSRWSDPASRPLFKGSLIDDSGCCCAQGDCLRLAGWSDEQLRELTQEKADVEVARILGISRAESVLLRVVNDRTDGCPQDVFRDRAKVLGPHHELWTAFARHIDTIDAGGWRKVAAARDAAWDTAGDAAWDAAGDAAGDDAGDDAWTAAWDAARDAARTSARDAAGDAAIELIGWSRLKTPFFLRFFFSDPAAWVASVEGGAA